MAINKSEMSLDREELKKTAAGYHDHGFNCAQSVICALAPYVARPQDAFSIAEASAPAWAA